MAHERRLHRTFCYVVPMVPFDAYRIITPFAANPGAGPIGLGQDEPDVGPHIDTRSIQHDKS